MIEVKSPAWWRATLALCLGSMLVFINLYAPQPLLPDLRESYQVSTLMIGLVMSLATLTLAASLLIYGPLSDAIGRGGIMRLSLLGAALVTLMLAWAPNIDSLLVLRAVQGLALGGLPAVAIAWMGDEFEPAAIAPAVGLYIAANTLGGIGGRVLGGSIGDWQSPDIAFMCIGIITLAGVAVFWRLLPPVTSFRPQSFRVSRAAGSLAGHLRNPLLLGAYLVGGLNFLVFINQYSYMTFRLADAPFHLDAHWLGLLFLTYLGGTLGSSLSARVASRLSATGNMIAGIVIMMIGTAITLLPVLAWIVVGLTISAFGFFLCHATASGWVGRQATQARGSASALYLVFYYLGASLGPLWMEPFWLWARWPGIALGSWLVLLVTLGLAVWLGIRQVRLTGPATGCTTEVAR
ncbi:MFS transporter [Halomonas cupida]|uniref:MFS transporter n=1 Tax=Halomonas cupida TaxID=44933 RepID=UPI003A92444E